MDWKMNACIILYVVAGVFLFIPGEMYRSKKFKVLRCLVNVAVGAFAFFVAIFVPSSFAKWGLMCCATVMVVAAFEELLKK